MFRERKMKFFLERVLYFVEVKGWYALNTLFKNIKFTGGYPEHQHHKLKRTCVWNLLYNTIGILLFL